MQDIAAAAGNTSLVVQVVLSVVTGVFVTIAGMYAWHWLRDRIRIIRLTRQEQPQVEGLLELYAELFPDQRRNYTPDQILSMLESRQGQPRVKHTPCTDVVLVAAVRKKVVGFVLCHYYHAASHGVVSYCGRDPQSEEARLEDGMGQLFERLLRELRDANPPCTAVIFEVGEAKLKAVFKRRASQLGFRALELKIDYQRPKYSLEAEAEGDPLHFIVTGLSGPGTGVVTKREALTYLETIHLLGYGDFYGPSDPRHHEYQQYLQSRVNGYRERMTDPVLIA